MVLETTTLPIELLPYLFVFMIIAVLFWRQEGNRFLAEFPSQIHFPDPPFAPRRERPGELKLLNEL